MKRQSAVEQVQQEYEEKLKRALVEDAEAESLAKLKLPVEPRRVHIHNTPLYGVVGTVSFGEEYGYETIPYNVLPGLVTLLSPVKMTLTKGTFTSFMPTEHVKSIPENDRRWESETDVSPLRLCYEFESRTIIEWVARVGDRLLSVHCAMPRIGSQRIASYSVEREEFKGGHRYLRPRVVPQVITIRSMDDVAVAQAESPIIWSSGSDTPSRATIYWIDIGQHDVRDVGVWQAESFARAARNG